MRYLLSLSAALLATLVVAASADAATTVKLTPGSGQPGAAVTVSGTGFAANAAVDIFFGTSAVALATSNASGAVSAGRSAATRVTLHGVHAGRLWVAVRLRGRKTAMTTVVPVRWPRVRRP